VTMPNFLVIGAGKSGTTSLYHYLSQHPEVYMSPMKEPKFFCFEGEKPTFQGPGDDEEINRKCVTTIDAYKALFEGVADEKAVGEASSMYLYYPRTPERIRRHVPDARLIAVLRNPVERAYSSYLHCVRDRGEPLGDFAEALCEEEERIDEGWGPLWHYKTVGFYFDQLRRYFDTFDRCQIRIYLYEDLNTDAGGVLRDIFDFLDVDDSYAPDISLKHNVSGVPRSRVLHALLNKPNPIKTVLKPLVPVGPRRALNHRITGRNLLRPRLAPEVRRRLVEAYSEDVTKVQDLIQRDLSKWLEG
jgi:hypothetical protein